MTHMKQLVLVVIVAIGLTLVTSGLAVAQEDYGPIELANTVDAQDPDDGATGTATLTVSRFLWNPCPFFGEGSVQEEVCFGALTVSCHGLTPGATYRIGPTEELNRKREYKRGGPSYSYVKASDVGAVELSVPVSFVTAEYRWVLENEWGIWMGHWELVWYRDGYWFFVDRKQGSKYIQVLEGLFRW